MLVDPVTTWFLVRISPVELMIMPVPAAWPLPSVVLMSTIAGSTLAAIALTLELPEPVPGVAALIGDSGVVAFADWWDGLTARPRLPPMPPPAAAATTAISTMKAAILFQNEPGCGGGGVGAHGGGAPTPSEYAGGRGDPEASCSRSGWPG